MQDGERFLVILGDNIFDANLSSFVKDFNSSLEDGTSNIFVKEVKDPSRFGVMDIDEETGKITQIIEKPENPPTNLAVVGLYMFDTNVYRYVEQICPSERGELEIADVLNMYAEEDRLNYNVLPGFWSDAGTFESYFSTNKYFAEKECEIIA